jgi:hypothetical protein
LRLISSAAHPDDRLAIRRKFFLSRPTLSTFWGAIGFGSTSERRGYDHYHAVPLSDGHHVLFIEPSNGKLILGCDAPLGGPAKLLRKIILVPPSEETVPRLYTAGADLSHGARIVGIYGNTIMLYSVPPGILSFSQTGQKGENWDADKSPSGATNITSKNHWLKWWDVPLPRDADAQTDLEMSKSTWPIAIYGTEIGRLSDVCELAVQTKPEITIWAFTHSSQVRSWRLQNYIDAIVRHKQFVCQDGIVHDSHSIDHDGDLVVHNALQPCTAVELPIREGECETSRAERSIAVGFDGHASGVMKRMPKALAVENDDWVDLVDVRGCSDAWYDEDGDVVMFSGN